MVIRMRQGVRTRRYNSTQKEISRNQSMNSHHGKREEAYLVIKISKNLEILKKEMGQSNLV